MKLNDALLGDFADLLLVREPGCANVRNGVGSRTAAFMSRRNLIIAGNLKQGERIPASILKAFDDFMVILTTLIAAIGATRDAESADHSVSWPAAGTAREPRSRRRCR